LKGYVLLHIPIFFIWTQGAEINANKKLAQHLQRFAGLNAKIGKK